MYLATVTTTNGDDQPMDTKLSVWNGTTRTAGRGLNNTTATLATTDAPAHGDFITNNTSPFDWRR